MGQMEKVGMIRWVLPETEAPFFTWFAWELWVIIRASRKASHTVCVFFQQLYTGTFCSNAWRHFGQHSLYKPSRLWSWCFRHLLLFSCPEYLVGKSHSSQLLTFTPQEKTLCLLYLPSATASDYCFARSVWLGLSLCPLVAEQSIKNTSNYSNPTLDPVQIVFVAVKALPVYKEHSQCFNRFWESPSYK